MDSAMRLKVRSLETELERLNDELWFTRHTVIGLMPKDLRSVLANFDQCRTREDVYGWQQKMFEQVLEHADPRPPKEMGEYSSVTPRAHCPLCGGSAQDVYGAQGFAYPD